ncbi:UDP-N-acetylmuramoyl-L-alanyl-D-glutamate--2,6-diaminopimelate ligase [Teichococcus vastitatis]|uniref:UDP-N-acetylmuramoyl-L-alanyl-D-glutamate--2,6-diaminopimelate ligase n=1 Tax=Teichococcus vastitatis TaxID=2307076 RepID=A0ABS9W4L7_9PROT|nr:UDP-N-acetylmuramoyl-L-alanyl-D-glutamate--2,6-diaminopimelate ligase [Pseudoroseomonas vastitatis]MCI0754233.1 UDP-N-acetylmuramoyl-L-alanyl-D-glutamate--2,6-diaminopimelate ligase [Pseudoroseomonas vastitatis]
MRLEELLHRVPGLLTAGGVADAEVAGLTADSRAVRPGFVFAALPGTKLDGRAFIAEAARRGAIAILVPAGTPLPEGVSVPLIPAEDARRALALLAAALHAPPPAVAVAVTGTNGKTSTVDFLRQIWAMAGLRPASLGTLGLRAEGFPPTPSLTTPDPVALHRILAELAAAGIGHVALEASSHGLEQRRLDGLRLAAGGFSNLTRDHLDYHGDMAAYAAAKLRLFDTLLQPGAASVAHSDLAPEVLARLRDIAARRELRLLTVGSGGEAIRLLRQQPVPDGQVLEIDAFGMRAELHLALPGRFQADNALLAAGLAVASGLDAPEVIAMLPRLTGVRGRMECAAVLPNGAAVYVDYAHTPDALERLLTALRPHTAGSLRVVFGAGGDRDPGKRPLMGEVASRLADHAIVTDDNPRTENPAAIRAAVRAGMTGSAATEEIGDRATAIGAALAALRPGDVLALAGKGHESGQTIGTVTYPFDDAEAVRRLVGAPA